MGIISSAQEYEKGIFRLKLKSENAKPTNQKVNGKFANDDKINGIFKKYNVISYEQAYPFAKNPELLKIYKVKFVGDDENFKRELEARASDLVANVSHIHKLMPTYDPSDYMWYLTTQNPNEWLWHLKKIQADQAWDITKSNSIIKIADVDTNFDILHPDLSGKISPNYDPVTNIVHSAIGESHGTHTSSFAAAQTDGGGQLAAVGFNSSLIAYTWDDGVGKALHASDVMNADVITISWGYCGIVDTDEALMIKEILDNGTIVVAAAGNGQQHCDGGPLMPFSPLVDSRIICVTSTGVDDKHYNSSGTHSGYPSVSICAPGYGVMGATATTFADGTPNTWPYYGSMNGTSFATPIVAGVCALMKSINPCLTPQLAKSIIQSTADPVVDASSYPNMVGAGRINAFNAVKLAGTKSITGSIGGTTTYSSGYATNLSNVLIQNNSNIAITARKEVNVSGSFEVTFGSTINFSIDPNAINSCN